MAIVTSGSPDFISFTAQNTKGYSEPEPDAEKNSVDFEEPDPDDSSDAGTLNKEMEINSEHDKEPDPDDGTSGFVQESGDKMEVETELRTNTTVLKSQPDPDDSSNSLLNQEVSIDGRHRGEPDSDASTCGAVLESGDKILNSEPDLDDQAADLNNNELQRIEEPVAALCSRLQKAIEMLRSQATPSEAASVLQTLFKIIKNVIENPNDIRYKRLRKSNPHFQRSVANYKAAMEVLELIGFCEDVVSDEIGRAETYLVLKRNDPGLLWLAKSSLEVSMG
ncbi:hypothetical protein ACQ4PT_038004 [Festuca glaucescens]